MNLHDPQATGPEQAETIGTWRVTYAPGPWVALVGPDALVVMPPAPARAEAYLARLWEAVVPSASVDELVAELARAGVTDMPDMVALFWDQGSMHSLVRGRLRLVDPDSGEVIAAGEGIRTWSETGLGDRRSVLVIAEGDAPVPDEALRLPLVVGAATVGSLLVEAQQDRLVACPAAAPRTAVPEEPAEEPVEEETEVPADTAAAIGAAGAVGAAGAAVAMVGPDTPHGQVYDPMHPESDEPRTLELGAIAEPPPEEPAEQPAPAEPDQPDQSDQSDQSEPVGPAGEPSPVMAVLRPITGAPVTVDRPVLVGRAPDPARLGGDATPKLMTVPSPSHDISRTHLKVEPVGRTVQVTDLHSTNGTVLVTGPVGGDPSVAGQRHPLVPGEPVAVQPGWILDLGDGVTILIDRT